MSAVCYSSVFTVALTCQQIKHAKKWCRRVAEQCAYIKGLVQEIKKKTCPEQVMGAQGLFILFRICSRI